MVDRGNGAVVILEVCSVGAVASTSLTSFVIRNVLFRTPLESQSIRFKS